VSERTWEDKLSEAQRQALAQAVEDTIAYVAEIVDEMNEGFVAETIANGMVLVEPDQEALRAAALPAVTRIIEEDLAPGVYNEVLEVIGQED
jgi:TRAP-type C4-dicarboxylate transport system substrate-binding protein